MWCVTHRSQWFVLAAGLVATLSLLAGCLPIAPGKKCGESRCFSGEKCVDTQAGKQCLPAERVDDDPTHRDAEDAADTADTIAPDVDGGDTSDTAITDAEPDATDTAGDADADTRPEMKECPDGESIPVDDNCLPVVSIANPTKGETVCGTVVIEAMANDYEDESPAVEFAIEDENGNDVSPDSRDSESAEQSWDSTEHPDGNYILDVTVSDAEGAEATATHQLTVRNKDGECHDPPTVNFLSPADDSRLRGASVDLEVEATDPETSVAQVVFSYQPMGASGSTEIATKTNSPWTTTWETTDVDDGSYVLSATATDIYGRIGQAQIGVEFDTTAPDITLVQPSSDGEVLLDGEQTFIAEVDDSEADVEFSFTDKSNSGTHSVSLTSMSNPTGKRWEGNFNAGTKFGSGSGHSWSVTATDELGNERTVTLKFGVDTAPTIKQFDNPSSSPISSDLASVDITVDDDHLDSMQSATFETDEGQTGSFQNEGSFQQSGSNSSGWTYRNYDQPVPDAGQSPITVDFRAEATDAGGQRDTITKTVTFEPYCGDGKTNGGEICDTAEYPDRCCGGNHSCSNTNACRGWVPGTFEAHTKLSTVKDNHQVELTDVETAASGNIAYAVGGFEGSLDFCNNSSSPPTATGFDTYVAKFTVSVDSVSCQWVETVGGNKWESPQRVEVGPNGDVYLLGNFQAQAAAGGTPLQSGGDSAEPDVWAMRISSSGQFHWLETLTWDGRAVDLVTDATASNNFVTLVQKEGANSGNYTYLVERWMAGAPIKNKWSAQDDGDTQITSRALLKDESMNAVYVAGEFHESSSGQFHLHGTNSTSDQVFGTGTDDGFLVDLAYDNGVMRNAANIGYSEAADRPMTAATDSNGDIWLGAEIQPDRNGAHAYCNQNFNNSSLALVEFDPSSRPQFSRKSKTCLTGANTALFGDIAVDGSDDIYASGFLKGSLNVSGGGSSISAPGSKNGFVVSYDKSLNHLWDATLKGEVIGEKLAVEPGPSDRLVGGVNFQETLTVGGHTYNTRTYNGTDYSERGLFFSMF